MEHPPSATVYRIKLADTTCRSALALLVMRVETLAGVRAATVTAENELIFVSHEGIELFDEIVEIIIRAGLDPVTASVSSFECRVDKDGVSLQTALALGLVRPSREPVRATPVQRVNVHVNGGYDPDTIILSAHLPTEISFSEGHECLARVVFDSLGIEADLQDGGALVALPALEPGTYQFRCGRDVVRGTLIAE